MLIKNEDNDIIINNTYFKLRYIMYNKTLYHGTEFNRGKGILKSQKMLISRGDKHWLGDGCYFYEDDFYAYKWIKDLYKSKYKEEPIPEHRIFSKYMILKSILLVDIERIFDLDNPRLKIEFDRIYEYCVDLKKYSEKFKKVPMAEGVVLNIMFNDMGYSENFDLVIATFKRRSSKYKGIPMRIKYMSEKQICIKNKDKVTSIELYECEDKISEFEFLIENLYKITTSPMVNNKDRTYISKKRKKYKL